MWVGVGMGMGWCCGDGLRGGLRTFLDQEFTPGRAERRVSGAEGDVVPVLSDVEEFARGGPLAMPRAVVRLEAGPLFRGVVLEAARDLRGQRGLLELLEGHRLLQGAPSGVVGVVQGQSMPPEGTAQGGIQKYFRA